MAPEDLTSPSDQHELLKQILSTVQSIQRDYQQLFASVQSIQGQVSLISGVKQLQDIAGRIHPSQTCITPTPSTGDQRSASETDPDSNAQASSLELGTAEPSEARSDGEPPGRKPSATATSRIILTTYPGQAGIDPLIMNWGHADALERGPVVVSRNQSTIRRRNGTQGCSLFSVVSLTFV